MTPSLDNAAPPRHTLPEVEGEAIPVIRVRKTRVQRGYAQGKAPWVLRWEDPATGRVRQETIGRGRERWAEALREVKMAELNGCRVDAQGGTTWRAFVRRCLAALEVELAPGSFRLRRQVLYRFTRLMKPRVLQAVDRAAVNEYRLLRLRGDPSRNLRGVSRTTAEKDLRELSAAFSWAVGENLIRSNPCDGIRWVGRPHRAIKPALSAVETRRFLDLLGDLLGDEPVWIEASLRLAALWGSRTGDLARIRPEDVDLAERWIWIRARGRYDAPKNRRDRAIPLATKTGGLVQELMVREEGVGLLWGPRRDPFTAAGGKNGYRKAVVKAARRLLAAVGHADVDQPIQMLRRTAETNLRRRGVAPEAVALILGHSTSVGDRFYDARATEEVLRGVDIDGAADWDV